MQDYYTHLPAIPAASLFEIARRLVDERYPDEGAIIAYVLPARLSPHGRPEYYVRHDDAPALFKAHRPQAHLTRSEPTHRLA